MFCTARNPGSKLHTAQNDQGNRERRVGGAGTGDGDPRGAAQFQRITAQPGQSPPVTMGYLLPIALKCSVRAGLTPCFLTPPPGLCPSLLAPATLGNPASQCFWSQSRTPLSWAVFRHLPLNLPLHFHSRSEFSQTPQL